MLRSSLKVKILCLIFLLVAASLFSLASGAINLFHGHLDPVKISLALELRFPRLVFALLVGASLAVAGNSIQCIFKNPLADPGLLGISGGAALFTALYILTGFLKGLGTFGIWGASVAAFLGAILVVILVYQASRVHGEILLSRMLLAGVAINALVGSVIGVIIFMSNDDQLRNFSFWMLGSLSFCSWAGNSLLLAIFVCCFIYLYFHAEELNLMMLGETEAAHHGVETNALKKKVILCSTLLVGACVSLAGPIGFIGLVVPHIARMIFGGLQKVVLPTAALMGAIFLSLADTLSRSILPPAEISVGVLTALVGAPFFFALIWRERNRL